MVRLRRGLVGLALGTVLIAATILAWPKDPGYAAPQRLVLAILLLGTIIPAIAVSCAVWGRFREARLALAYHGAPRPLAVAVRFLLDERRLAARHMIGLLTLALGAGAFHILSHWPQLAPLAPFRGGLAVLGLAAAAGLVLLPIWRRGHWVNRDSILIEEAPVSFAEANGFRMLAADRIATNPAIAFRVEAFLPVEGFTPSKAFATRLLWRDLDGDEQSKLLLSEPETVLAVVVRGVPDRSFAHLQPAQLGAGRKGRLPTPSGSARS